MGRGFFNGSAEGYAKGHSDGLNGRPKSPVGSFSEAVAHAVRPKSYTETFVKEYGRGFVDGTRQRNAPPKPERSFYQEQYYKDQYFKNRRAEKSKEGAKGQSKADFKNPKYKGSEGRERDRER